MKELVEFVARHLVTKPEEVIVESSRSDKTVSLLLKVAPEDLGRVIGKEGRTIRSLRTLVGAAAAKAGLRASLEVSE